MSESEFRRFRPEYHGSKKVAHFELRDYLSPGEKYPYNDLPKDMEDARRAGFHVYLWSVPHFMMVSGHPDISYRPWHICDFGDKWVSSAREAIS